MSLYEPIYTDGGDPLYVMDQIKDKKSSEENWVEEISLREAMNRLPDGNAISSTCASLKERPRPRLLRKSTSARPRCQGLRKTR